MGPIVPPSAVERSSCYEVSSAMKRSVPGQQELISAVLAGRDALGILATGGGKSLTFALPARLLGGTTVVFSPLVALMRNHLKAMIACGVRASLLNSDLGADEGRVPLDVEFGDGALTPRCASRIAQPPYAASASWARTSAIFS